MDYNNLDLRNKTIFDFTNDVEILNELGYTADDSFFESLDDTKRAFSLIDYAEYIGDEQLIKAIEKEFELELSAFFNE